MADRGTETKGSGIWYWKSNPDPWSETQYAQWTTFFGIENEIIERAYLNKIGHASLENYIIDFTDMVQVHRKEKHKKRPVKRDILSTVNSDDCVLGPGLLSPGEPGEVCRVVWEWAKQENDSCHILKEENAAEIIDKAADGILVEGKLLKREAEGRQFADGLKTMKGKSLDELSVCCVALYATESFMYKLVTRTLQEDDLSKITTIGPFGFLLNNALWRLRSTGNFTVYRGVNMDRIKLVEYKSHIGKV
ncbi:unnamed protein product [Didymodactylos carnosus]|uniref:WWE domain-containing protein n=1 Tax=Didymodactylos carnosus TaxID=1234261 RepID=A0A814JFL4_9BILA|nr:unnamed protein product [Didymodactylos carnosus]CAF3805864.1 unnamed protein product [Didymodactylos carnosus]